MDIRYRLKIMLFMQYFIWGCWLVTLGAYMMRTLNFSGAEVGIVYSSKGIAAILMPGIIGIIADKYIPANRLYMICHLVCAGTLFYAASVTDPTVMFLVMMINAMAFMPTIALSNSISYSSLSQYQLDSVTNFPPVRVYGTVGFIIAMWLISLLKFELSSNQLYIAGGCSLLLAVYSLTLPHIPVVKKAITSGLGSKLGLDALVLFKQPIMVVFFLFSLLLGAVLQITNTFGSPFLHDFARNPDYQDSLIVQYPSLLLSISQMAEVCFILAIPFVLKRYGIKTVMLLSMLAWTLRFGFFALGDPSAIGLLFLILSMIVYGCAFDFFNISGSIFIEKTVDTRMRASAQGLFMTMVNGVGAYFGAILSGRVVDYFSIDGVKDWPTIWLVFAAYTAVLSVIFYFTFHYHHKEEASAC
ncbi:nucleoside permease [Pantoea coffeiphila]|uniref:nucleoside permease n=1 Tax=Pantoea coffeiphila TaxID=1465635 RepID=UPI00195F917C|nr:nucleoside permease [Pantoea coffeiphila]MBM7345352.1 NHS family xanthosine MFS transporter [Pantoea coffeiphila]